MNKKELGAFYESVAISWYSKRGARIRERNLFTSMGEIDILAEENGRLVVVEVRGRERPEYRPSLFLHSTKIARIKRLAAWVSAVYRKPVRVDFFEVIGQRPRRGTAWLCRMFPSFWGYRLTRFEIL